MTAGGMDRLRALFVSEGRRRLDALVEGLLAVEARTADAEVVEGVLREAHSLKGSAGLVGFPEITRIAHEVEAVLEQLRDGALEPTADVVDPLLGQVDAMRRILEGSAAPAAPPAADPPAADPPAADPPAADPPAPDPPAPDPPAAGEGGLERLPVAVDRLDEVIRLAGEVRGGLLRLRGALAEQLADAAPGGRGDVDEALPVLRELELAATGLQREVAAARTVPVSEVAAALQRAVRDAARARGTAARFALTGGDVEVDRAVLARVEDALVHLVRNAVAHGIEDEATRRAAGKDPVGRVELRAGTRRGRIQLVVADDGRGLDRAALEAAAAARGVAGATGTGDGEDGEDGGQRDWTALVFEAGLSTAGAVDDIAGRGVGMDVVSRAARAARGAVLVDTTPGGGTAFTLDLPVTLAVTRCAEVSAGRSRYAVPLSAVEVVLGANAAVEVEGGRAVLRHRDDAVPLVDLGVITGAGPQAGGPVLLLRTVHGRAALRVGAVVRHGEVTVQPLGGAVPTSDTALGVAVAADGSALVVLDPAGLLRLAAEGTGDPAAPATAGPTPVLPGPRRRVLVVDDALTIRELQRAVLERAGYAVTVAEDGREALALLARDPVDLVVTDVEMPRMDGFALTEAIRQADRGADVPVLILTSRDDDEHRRRGVEAGADGYLIKSAFTAEAFLAAVAAQIGGAADGTT